MSCTCSTTLAGRAGEPGVLIATGADPAPDAHRGSGRLAAARSATAAIAATRTMASVIFGVITFFITHFLSFGLRRRSLALPSGPACPAHTALWTATAGASTWQMSVHRPRTPCGRQPVPRDRRSPQGPRWRLLSLAGPGRSGPPGTGQRLGPDHVRVPRVGRHFLRPDAHTPDPPPAGADALHHPASGHRGTLATGGLACLGRLCCVGADGEAASSLATARAQRIRFTAASGWSPNSWATRWTHPRPP